MAKEQAIFGAGCFWGVEESFSKLDGVISTRVGYCGGDLKKPSYEDVCSGETGHAEVCEVIFDPEKISYEKLLGVFWQIHDPTTLNRQGPDIGTQYRSVIFYKNPDQKAIAEASKAKIQEHYQKQIATAIEPIQEFYEAEEYHQQYIKKIGH